MAHNYHISSFSTAFFVYILILCLFIYLGTTKIPSSHLYALRGDEILEDVQPGWVLRSDGEGYYSTKSLQPRIEPVSADYTYSSLPSPYIVTREEAMKDEVRRQRFKIFIKSTEDRNGVKTISYFDPNNEQPTLMSTDFSSCDYSACTMSHNLEAADVVVFLATKLKRTDVPTFKRHRDQVWVFYTNEAQSRFSWFAHLDRPGIREGMNWTMTHRLDSDIPVPYGKLLERDEVPIRDYDAIFEVKSKSTAWFVSHCPVKSKRMQYVSLMKQRLDINIYGQCGDLKCGMYEKVRGMSSMRQKVDSEMCFPMLSANYKFYLAFENSLCQEYITEKFFKLFQGVDVIPVVRGGADYHRYFPQGIFIDAADFSTPQDLADFLIDLGEDKERYIEYLRRKDMYELASGVDDWHCKLCEKIHTEKGVKTYDNIREWFVKESCFDVTDLPVLE